MVAARLSVFFLPRFYAIRDVRAAAETLSMQLGRRIAVISFFGTPMVLKKSGACDFSGVAS